MKKNNLMRTIKFILLTISAIVIFLALFLSCSQRQTSDINDDSPVDINQRRLIMRSILADENYVERKEFFIKLINDVRQETPVIILHSDLIKTKSFLEMEKYSDELINYAIALLQDKDVPHDYRAVIVYAIQRTDFEKYKYFLVDLAISFVDEKIDEGIVSLCLWPGTWFLEVFENYQDPIVIQALNILLESNKISSGLRKSILFALRGGIHSLLRDWEATYGVPRDVN